MKQITYVSLGDPDTLLIINGNTILVNTDYDHEFDENITDIHSFGGVKYDSNIPVAN